MTKTQISDMAYNNVWHCDIYILRTTGVPTLFSLWPTHGAAKAIEAHCIAKILSIQSAVGDIIAIKYDYRVKIHSQYLVRKFISEE